MVWGKKRTASEAAQYQIFFLRQHKQLLHLNFIVEKMFSYEHTAYLQSNRF